MAILLLLGLLAILIAAATAILVMAVVTQAGLLDQLLGREALTVAAAATLFGVVFVVVGAGAALRHLVTVLLQRKKARTRQRGTRDREDTSRA